MFYLLLLLCGVSQQVAVSGAPVTDWLAYDTGYTERFLGIPADNEVAYMQGSVLTAARSFPDRFEYTNDLTSLELTLYRCHTMHLVRTDC